MVKHTLSPGFTLIELLIAMGMLGIIATMTIVAINPQKQLCDAQNAKRLVHARELEKALQQHLIGEWSMASEDVEIGEENALPICREGITDPSCINIDVLIPDYLSGLPIDETETSTIHIGYAYYLDEAQRQIIVPLNAEECADAAISEEGGSSASSALSSSEPSSDSSNTSSSVGSSSSTATSSSSSMEASESSAATSSSSVQSISSAQSSFSQSSDEYFFSSSSSATPASSVSSSGLTSSSLTPSSTSASSVSTPSSYTPSSPASSAPNSSSLG